MDEEFPSLFKVAGAAHAPRPPCTTLRGERWAQFHRYSQEKTMTKKEKRTTHAYAHGLISEYISEDLSKALLYTSEKQEGTFRQTVEAGEDYTKFNSADFALKPPKKMDGSESLVGEG
ncbi:ribonuclease H2 subunit B [Lates japonicus]|uniref:Ribonuclease H2 subunit B n=1 Tax=Lates japonicus TaxID=270547 RepID=A0AAD3NDT4_LATJO|nr:ribonuclease H2 subunit B [Lates japonicus]